MHKPITATGARGGRRAATDAPFPPASNTGGKVRDQISAARVRPDWLAGSFPEGQITVDELPVILGVMFGLEGFAVLRKSGLNGYREAYDLLVIVGDGDEVVVGQFAHGGNAATGFMQFTGQGCELVKPEKWGTVAALLETRAFRVSRLDLCCDFLGGEQSVDDAIRMYAEGAFKQGGRPPSRKLIDDYGTGEGRTFYVGRRENGKLLRVYEKGRQLGLRESMWVRWEMELRRVDRFIPLDALRRPAEFFAGCYPALASIVEAAAECIRVNRAKARMLVSKAMQHCSESYGKLLWFLRRHFVGREGALLDQLSVKGVPDRLIVPAIFGRDLALDGV